MPPDRDPLAEILQRLDARATWDDLVLPESVTRRLQRIAQQARRRKRRAEGSSKQPIPGRPPGHLALFSGPAGTGKTMAAEALATALRFDLFRVDLTAVVSKYIGETEKNLRRLFEAANAPDVILLFDEADALFGERSEVDESRDRYASVELKYLLQWLEQFAGLAIVTTGRREALDPELIRRMHYVVEFPSPDVEPRKQGRQRSPHGD